MANPISHHSGHLPAYFPNRTFIVSSFPLYQSSYSSYPGSLIFPILLRFLRFLLLLFKLKRSECVGPAGLSSSELKESIHLLKSLLFISP